jgi:hypothetical protein
MNPIDWPEARNLLLKLLKDLTPFTDRPGDVKTALLNKRFSIPFFDQSDSLKPRIQLLSNLKSVSDWMGKVTPPARTKPQVTVSSTEIAQKLVEQVRGAIHNLSSSSFLNSPKDAQLRDVMRKIKPLLDDLIETVTQVSESQSSNKERPFKQVVPVQLREAMLKKQIAFPHGIAVPYTAPARSARREKNKRKGSWFGGEEKDSEKQS